MALDVYFREDILNVLRAAYVAGEGPTSLAAQLTHDPDLGGVPADKLLQAYRCGFITALGAVGLAFGLDSRERAGDELQIPALRSPAGLRATVEPQAEGGARPLDTDMMGFLWAEQRRPSRPR
jgi:hypothetical protein